MQEKVETESSEEMNSFKEEMKDFIKKNMPKVEVNMEVPEKSLMHSTAFKVGALVVTHATIAYLGYTIGKRAGWNESMSAGQTAAGTNIVTETL